jgi:type IV pilus assembly protein PilW
MTNETAVIDGATELGGAPPATFTATQQARSAICGSTATGNYFVVNLFEDVNGSNNSYTLTCAALNYQAASDALWLRRASGTRPTAMNTNRIHVQTSHDRGWLFVPSCSDPEDLSCIPDGADPLHSQSRELFAHVYYVSSRSTNRTDVPALRRKRFVNANGAAGTAFIDEEIVPGVEDLQVQFGVDGPDADTNVDQYVNPGAIPADSRVVSARIWLRIRAEDRDFGFVDGRAYQYADMAAAVTPNDNYRRILLTKTIHIRNSRELDE